MKKLKVVHDLSMRSCLFHPTQLAAHWSGHVHYAHSPEIHILVGRCKYCPIDDTMETTSYQSPCQGCFGLLDGFR